MSRIQPTHGCSDRHQGYGAPDRSCCNACGWVGVRCLSGGGVVLDLVVRNARISGSEHELVDIGIADGVIKVIAPGLETDAPQLCADGELVVPGFVDTHIHLDKSRIAHRSTQLDGTLEDAIAETGRLKAAFTVEDIYERAARTLESCVASGTTRMRTHVEVDPTVGLRGSRLSSSCVPTTHPSSTSRFAYSPRRA